MRPQRKNITTVEQPVQFSTREFDDLAVELSGPGEAILLELLLRHDETVTLPVEKSHVVPLSIAEGEQVRAEHIEFEFFLDPTDAARAVRRHRVSIEEQEDGSLSFWHGEHELHATAFPKDDRVQQGEVVESKRLSATVDFIKEKQRQRIEAKIAKPSTTLRDTRLLRVGTPRRTAVGAPSMAPP